VLVQTREATEEAYIATTIAPFFAQAFKALHRLIHFSLLIPNFSTNGRPTSEDLLGYTMIMELFLVLNKRLATTANQRQHQVYHR